jgi:hypothetical protein
MSAALQNIGKHLGSKVAFVLEVLFWQPQKSKNTTLLPSYWIYSFGPPKKQKHNPSALLLDLLFWQPPQKKLVPSNWICFLESHKKEKTQPFCNAQAQLLCLVLDLLFWRPKKSKNSLYDQVLA